MPTTSTYYLNAPSLASATAVFTNAAMTVCAPNGYYTDGLVTRQQVGCVLLPIQVCPECPPISYNCISGECIDPGDGTGTYSTLEECDLMCPPPSISLGAPICRENNCNDNAACTVQYGINTSNAPVGGYITVTIGFPSSTATVTIINSSPSAGRLSYFEPSGSATPVYFTLELRTSGGTIIATQSTSLTHQSFWPMLPLCTIPVTYNCVSGNCIDPGDGSGTYSTLLACEAACSPPPAESYNCISGECVDPGDGSGTYSTLLACEAACPTPPPVSYNCISGECIDPGDGTGTYSTLLACEAACTPPVVSVTSVSANYTGGGSSSVVINATVNTDNPVDVATTFSVKVTTNIYGDVSVVVGIPIGGTTGSGATVLFGATTPPVISDACINSTNNPAIVISGFECVALSANLAWSFNNSLGSSGYMGIFVNGIEVISQYSNNIGNYPVFEGDVIQVTIQKVGCSGGTSYANVYTTGIIVDASCAANSIIMTTTTYTVTNGDIGLTLSLNGYTSCDGACV